MNNQPSNSQTWSLNVTLKRILYCKTKMQKSEAFTVKPHESVLQIFSPFEISAFMTSQKYLGLLKVMCVIARESKKRNTSNDNFLTKEKQHISSSTFTTWPRVSHAAAVAFSQKTTLIVLQNFYKSPVHNSWIMASGNLRVFKSSYIRLFCS